MNFSRRSANPAGRSSELVARIEQLRESHSIQWDLTTTDCTGWPDRNDLELQALSLLVRDGKGCRYEPDPQGELRAREILSGSHRDHIPAEDWLLCASTSEAYSILFQLVCDPGDKLVINRPSYPLLDDLARHGGVVLVDAPLRWVDSQWRIDIGQLERRFRDPAVKAFCLIQPGNPTGWFLSDLERDKVVSLCASHGVVLICDEVFADYTYRSGFRSLRGESGCLVFTLSGLSKGFGLPGLKLGWVSLSGKPLEVSQARERLQRLNDSLLSASTPVQLALEHLVAMKSALLKPILDRIDENLQAWSNFSAPRSSALQVWAGWMAVLQLEPGTEDGLSHRLLDRGIVVHPGFLFDMPWDCVVVSLLTDPKTFQQGLTALREELQGISSLFLKILK